MNFLIRNLAHYLARFIESGSLWGAAAGAVLGVALAWITAYFMHQADILDKYWIGAAIVFSVVFGVIAAAAGSRLFPRELSTNRESVLLTNFNHALIAPFLLVVTIGVAGFVTADERRHGRSIEWKSAGPVIFGALFLILTVITCRVTLAVRVGEEIVFYRVIFPRRFKRQEVRDWGFEVTRGRWSTSPPAHDSEFELKITGYPAFRKDVSPTTAECLAYVLRSSTKPASH